MQQTKASAMQDCDFVNTIHKKEESGTQRVTSLWSYTHVEFSIGATRSKGEERLIL